MTEIGNENRKTEIEQTKAVRAETSAFSLSSSVKLRCEACGTQARRENAQFCLICGKLLREGYQPLDNLRASYRMQGKAITIEREKKEEIINLFEQNKNSISHAAWACLVYSFVPYLGILFVPLTFLIGGFGVVAAHRQPHLGGRKLALVSFFLSFIVLAVQIFLWWLLYIIPELGRGI
jgi:hypothetical protein